MNSLKLCVYCCTLWWALMSDCIQWIFSRSLCIMNKESTKLNSHFVHSSASFFVMEKNLRESLGPFGATRGKVVASVTQLQSPTRTPIFPSKMHNFHTMSSVTEFESRTRLLLYPPKSGRWPDDIQLTTNCEHCSDIVTRRAETKNVMEVSVVHSPNT